jgi:hypothetical protein
MLYLECVFFCTVPFFVYRIDKIFFSFFFIPYPAWEYPIVSMSSYFLGGAVTTIGPLPFRRADKLGMVVPTFPVGGEYKVSTRY